VGEFDRATSTEERKFTLCYAQARSHPRPCRSLITIQAYVFSGTHWTWLFCDSTWTQGLKCTRQALALDEKRTHLMPSLWDHTNIVEGQNVREVWFRGDHNDVGGGIPYSKSNGNDHYSSLGNISLRWMVHQCLENDTFISFDRDMVLLYRQLQVLDDNSFEPNEWSDDLTSDGRVRTDSASLDQIDIRHKPHGTVNRFPPWKFLEFWPSCRPIQTQEGAVMTYVHV
jgi:hypothetical protein